MLWDGVFLVVAVVLAVNGYKRGLIASWRGIVAVILATVAVKPFYIDFSAWISERLRISPEPAVLTGYLMLWVSVEAILEIILAAFLKAGLQRRPGFFNRIAGCLYGLAKAAVILLLPLMATSVVLKIPAPPPDKSGLVLPQFASSSQSFILPQMKTAAISLLPEFGPFVVSHQAPSFKPDYGTLKTPAAAPDQDLDKILK